MIEQKENNSNGGALAMRYVCCPTIRMNFEARGTMDDLYDHAIGLERDVTTNGPDEGFGAWLLKQTKRDDWIGPLAKSAKGDPRFRANSTPDDLRKRLQEAGAEGDAFEAVDDAESEWMAS
jgi:hypothetical protein